jgi:hypothetical protein
MSTVRYHLDQRLRSLVWRGTIITGHAFWHDYSVAVAQHTGRFRSRLDIETVAGTSADSKLHERYHFDSGRECLMFSGGLDSVYAHVMNIMIPRVYFKDDRNIHKAFPDLSYPRANPLWTGQVELGGPSLLLESGFETIYYAQDYDSLDYHFHEPVTPEIMPDLHPRIVSKWTEYTGQKVKNLTPDISKVQMVTKLVAQAPEMLALCHCCFNLKRDSKGKPQWCGRCMKCLISEAVWECAGVRPPVTFNAESFTDASFRTPYLRRAAIDTWHYVIAPIQGMNSKNPRCRKIQELVYIFTEFNTLKVRSATT